MKEKIISEINLDLVFQCNHFSHFSDKLNDTKTKLIFESVFWEKAFLSKILFLFSICYSIDSLEEIFMRNNS